jgi:DNA (cytosine-5)-methyltransferase 1
LIGGAKSDDQKGPIQSSEINWPSKTIKAGVHGVPGGENTVLDDAGNIRYYTLRETARLQTFPDAHFFQGARIHVTRQIGNAVPCALAESVARNLFQLTESNYREQEKNSHVKWCASR